MTIYYLLFAASAAISYIFFGRKFFAVFQQCSYKPKCFFAALSNECKTETERLSTYSLTFFMYLLVFSVAFPLSQTLYAIALFLACLLFSLAVFLKSRPVKSVKLTARFVRMAIASCVLVVLAAVGSLKVALLIFGLKLPVCLVIPGVLFLITLSEPVVTCLGYYVLLPYDFIAFKLSVRKCKKKFEKYPELIRIGITGSYGKTTVKNILSEMLSAKYKVVKTPLSYNTPLGICIAAKNITRETEIFIAEMGARKRGDIKELCDIVKPDVGVITGICGQHLETFKTLENVKKAKNELIEALPPDGYAFFSSDGEGSRELYDKSAKRKIIAGRKEGLVHGVSYSDDADGVIIELSLDKTTYETRTFLRGEHNLGNICLAAAVALKLGVPPEKIILAITRLKPEKHRLEVFASNGITIIDDSYNANVESVKAAAKVLKSFGGKKFVVTPGIVEGGESSSEINKLVGRVLSGAADEIIAVGKNSDGIFEGVNDDVGFVAVKDIEGAKKILYEKIKKGDVVLFLNDVPDRYGV